MKRLTMIFLIFVSLVVLAAGCQQKNSSESGSANRPPQIGLGVASYANGTIYLAGWAADPEDGAPIKKVIIFVDGKEMGTARLGLERKDVAEHFKNSNWLQSGWDFKERITLDKGKHKLYAIAFDKNDNSAKSSEKEIDLK